MKTIRIAYDFTRTPGPRYRSEGSDSGEDFRKKILTRELRQAILSGEQLCIDLDGTAGYGTSFLEETFGGLIREEDFDLKTVKSVLVIKSDEKPKFIQEVETYLKRAEDERNKTAVVS